MSAVVSREVGGCFKEVGWSPDLSRKMADSSASRLGPAVEGCKRRGEERVEGDQVRPTPIRGDANPEDVLMGDGGWRM